MESYWMILAAVTAIAVLTFGAWLVFGHRWTCVDEAGVYKYYRCTRCDQKKSLKVVGLHGIRRSDWPEEARTWWCTDISLGEEPVPPRPGIEHPDSDEAA